jgi:predicted lipoprotein with Yx(FWY)xxD motif
MSTHTTPQTHPATDTNDTSSRKAGSRRVAVAVLFAAALVLGACGNDKDSQETTASQPATTSTVVAAQAGTSATPIAVRDSALGDILVGKDGLTLYGFTNDVEAVSTCEGACADAWPPVIVGANWTPGPGLDSGIFATAKRSDGTLQLVAGKWPLYYYSGDVAAGDVNGQGSGDVWFVVAPDGKLVKDPKPETGGTDAEAGEVEAGGAPVAQAETDLGTVLVDGEGNTLYGFTKDTAGTPTCVADCADAWPALTVEGGELPEGLDPEVFSIVDRPDGTRQLKAGKWPLYRFSGDAEAGETNGQGSGGVWFVVAPDGSLVKGDAPAASADEAPASDRGSDDDSGY